MRLQDFLTEKVFDIRDDVDMIYNVAFKKSIDYLNRGDYQNFYIEVYKIKNIIPSSELKSPDCIKSHSIHPIVIKCGVASGVSLYVPTEDVVFIILDSKTIEIINLYRENIDYVLGSKFQKKSILHIFSEETIKGSIAHELNHWIDDTLHNKFITKSILSGKFKHSEEMANAYTRKQTKNVGATNYEINSQVISFKEILNKYGQEKYDTFTMLDIYVIKPQLGFLIASMNKSDYQYYIKKLYPRLMREKLLGKSMKILRYSEVYDFLTK